MRHTRLLNTWPPPHTLILQGRCLGLFRRHGELRVKAEMVGYRRRRIGDAAEVDQAMVPRLDSTAHTQRRGLPITSVVTLAGQRFNQQPPIEVKGNFRPLEAVTGHLRLLP